jgi:membrane carboxypeptidase/penicillin-binding protein
MPHACTGKGLKFSEVTFSIWRQIGREMYSLPTAHMETFASVLEFAETHSSGLGLPIHFIAALLLIEDQRFPRHIGVDFLAVARAVRCNLFSIGKRQGASTLTQQLHNVRIMRRDKVYQRNFSRKCSQIFFALTVGRRLKKSEIVREYLDGVYWGRDLWGLEAASRWYFKKRPSQLNAEESFFLVERLASPNRISVRRVEVILQRPVIQRYLELTGSTEQGIWSHYR